MSEHEPVQRGQFYLRHAGRIVWPRDSLDLTDPALCPACHAGLKSAVCSVCRLDLRHPSSTELLVSSTEAALALERRAELIGRIRFETAAGVAPASARARAVDLPRLQRDAVVPLARWRGHTAHRAGRTL
ncbi:hypothetical protein [Cryobacterium sp. TMS1-13-1]|uniref:hypothetical protein n=1 Tax=Cryobacterium sp. TMS1-13-1 TaxID=1259220 RepID=UPI001068EB15|nr:hypothetical protein [Cryobacterium sp. TMS1-13-1]TFD20454.1 hypothetical protein E3T31_14040 [Cryobacterium sp. TMS1-13-1]